MKFKVLFVLSVAIWLTGQIPVWGTIGEGNLVRYSIGRKKWRNHAGCGSEYQGVEFMGNFRH